MPQSGHAKPGAIGSQAKILLQSKFDKYYLEEINQVKPGADGADHNKLWFYASLKGCFKPEPYTELVSRNQRSEISRVRLSAHHLCIETARYQKDTSAAEYPARQPAGAEGTIDDEYHLFQCPVFASQQQALFRKASTIIKYVEGLPMQDLVKILLCPSQPELVRLVNRYIKTRSLGHSAPLLLAPAEGQGSLRSPRCTARPVGGASSRNLEVQVPGIWKCKFQELASKFGEFSWTELSIIR
jgi:hypothetical protein